MMALNVVTARRNDGSEHQTEDIVLNTILNNDGGSKH